MSRNESTANETLKYTLIRSAILSAVSSVIYFAMLAIFAAILLKSGLSNNLNPVLNIIAAAVSALIAAYISVRPSRKNGIIVGAFSAVPCFLIIYAVTALATVGMPGIKMMILLGVMLVCGAIGGIAAANISKKT